MASITGMKDISATNISNSGEFRLGNNIDSGTAGEVIVSGGPNQPVSWGASGGAVHNPLTIGTNINLTSGNPSWDGSVAETINLDSALTGMTGITYTGGGTTLTGGGGAGNETIATYLDLTSTTNILPTDLAPLPSNVYETSPGVYAMAFSQGVWMPNDDSSYYNYAIEDDFTAPLVAGRGKVLSSSLELEGFFNIPNGWRATGILIDLRGSTGYKVSRSITIYEVKTWSSSNPITATYTWLGSTTTNTAYTLANPMDGQIDNSMWIEVSMSSTADYIAGGYIVLTKI
tara:strand:+ start:2434 stop:3297 length:864 start_codon:yes stop_codon:yes gene_type:complete